MYSQIASSIGCREGNIFITYILGLVNYLFKNPAVRLVYGLSTGLVMCFFMYGSDVIHLLVDTLVTYLFLALFGRRRSPFWIVLFTLLHLSYLHISRMINDYGGWSLDVTTIYMMSICKFSSICWSYEDGGKSDDSFKSEVIRQKKISERPSLLEVFGYMFHFSSSICGPSIDFKDFRSFINLENEYQEIPIVNCLKVTAVKALQWLILLALYFSLLPKFPLEWIASEDFSRLGALSMVGYYQIALLTIRIKYYVGWKLSHNGMILCGLAYYTAVDPATKQTVEKYDRAKNFDIYVVELNPNIKQKLTKWNTTVHLWLKYSIFYRLKSMDRKSFLNRNAALITFMVSAFWHGFYPTYYIMFYMAFLVEQVFDMLDKKTGYIKWLDRRFTSGGVVDYLGVFCFNMLHLNVLNYAAGIFCLVTWESSIVFMRNTYFFWLIGLHVVFGLVKYGLKATKDKKPE